MRHRLVDHSARPITTPRQYAPQDAFTGISSPHTVQITSRHAAAAGLGSRHKADHPFSCPLSGVPRPGLPGWWISRRAATVAWSAVCAALWPSAAGAPRRKVHRSGTRRCRTPWQTSPCPTVVDSNRRQVGPAAIWQLRRPSRPGVRHRTPGRGRSGSTQRAGGLAISAATPHPTTCTH